METWSWLVISLSLFAAAVGLMYSHARAWGRIRAAEGIGTEERDYRRAQFRRRMQTSGMLGVLALALFAGYWVPTEWPTVFVVYWSVVLLVVGWMGLLALADVISTRHHFGRIRDRYLVEQTRLEAELRRAKRVAGNGESGGQSQQPAEGGGAQEASGDREGGSR